MYMDLLQFFKCDHLPEHLQKVSKPFGELAAAILVLCPDNTSRDLALYDLLRAKDNAVRALVQKGVS
jgi:hypothetical protein